MNTLVQLKPIWSDTAAEGILHPPKVRAAAALNQICSDSALG
jgi:hypothetical protein